MDPDPDSDPAWIRIGIQTKMLDPDRYQMNTDPKPCLPNGFKSERPTRATEKIEKRHRTGSVDLCIYRI